MGAKGVQVSGQYSVMQEIIPALKRLKFRYNGNTRSWIHPTLGKKELEQVITKVLSKKEQQEDKALQVQQKKVQENQTLFKEALSLNWKWFSISPGKHNPDLLEIVGPTSSIKKRLLDAGAKRLEDATYVLYPTALESKELKEIILLLQKTDKEYEQTVETFLVLIKKWNQEGSEFCSLSFNFPNLQIEGLDRINDPCVQEAFPGVRKNGSHWELELFKVWPRMLTAFLACLIKKKEERIKDQLETERKQEEDAAKGILILRRAHVPYKEGERVVYQGLKYLVVEILKKYWMDQEDGLSMGFPYMRKSDYIYSAKVQLDRSF
jgi:hypothetical protein